MNLKDRLKNVFKETFLDLFQDEEPATANLDDSLVQARNGVAEATDALAAFSVAHIHLTDEQRTATQKIDALSEQLETALVENNDGQARELLRERQALQKNQAPLDERVSTSATQQRELKKRVAAMKARVLDIERKKLELQLRDRAADAIDQINHTEATIDQASDFAASADAEQNTLRKEATNTIAADERDTVDTRMEKLIEDDDIEQELARLKQQRAE